MWKGMLITTTHGTPSRAAFKRSAFWLWRKLSHQCSTTDSGVMTVTGSKTLFGYLQLSVRKPGGRVVELDHRTVGRGPQHGSGSAEILLQPLGWVVDARPSVPVSYT